uniref:Knottins-like domain-containing protein n=2 Tax=Aegilops tauschii TaxID=37682 RepID=A0A453DIB4_AEGTS
MRIYSIPAYLASILVMTKEMRGLKVPSLLCLLLLTPLLLPGSEADTCSRFNMTYTVKPPECKHDPCANACQKEGFTEGVCEIIRATPVFMRCLCKKEC